MKRIKGFLPGTTYISLLSLPLLAGMWCALFSCSKSVKPTGIMVQDSIRHYYPLVQGTDLTLTWRVANVGSTPLVITDIQPSCGCILEDGDLERVVAPDKEILLRFSFRSEKNSGYVKHSIRLFGNMEPQGMATLTFDLNVVPPALGSPDYEELYKNRNAEDRSAINTEAANDATKRDYWTDANEYARGYNKRFWEKR